MSIGNRVQLLREVISPRSVAVVGASEKGGLGTNVIINLKDCDASLNVYPVNPKYDKVFDIQCYPSLSDLPQVPDTVLIAVPARFVEKTIEEAVELKVKGGIVFSSGFAEVGDQGPGLQKRIVNMCKENGFLMLGPNCLGLLNVTHNIPLFGAPTGGVRKGSIGIVAQSGSATIIMSNAGKRLGYSYLFSTGNEGMITTEDYLEFLIEDEQTNVIGLFVEGIRNPGKLLSLSKIAIKKHKPIILLKVGRTERAAQIAKGHTGAMAGSYEIQKKALEKNGVIFVNDYSELVETLVLFEKCSLLPDIDKIGALAMSGGSGVLISDVTHESGVKLSDFNDKTVAQLRTLLPPYSPIRNPLDGVVGVYDPDAYGKCIGIIADDPDVGVVAVFVDCQSGLSERQAKTQARVALASAKAISGLEKPALLVSNLSDSYSHIVEDAIALYNIPTLKGTRETMLAIKHMFFYAEVKKRREHASIDDVITIASENKSKILDCRNRFPEASVPVYEASRLMAHYGITIPESSVAKTEEEAIGIARRIGYPVVLKIEASQIVHKSDGGFVKLNLCDDDEVATAYKLMSSKLRELNHELNGDGDCHVMVQSMAVKGTELVLGVKYDEQFGPAIILGWGGVFVEALSTFSMETLPLSQQDIAKMIDRMPGSKILKGFRGMPESDFEALTQAIMGFVQLAKDGEGLIEEAEINPLIVYPSGKGVMAVDARIIMK